MLYCSIYFFKRSFFDLIFLCVGSMHAFKLNLKAWSKLGSVFRAAAWNTTSVMPFRSWEVSSSPRGFFWLKTSYAPTKPVCSLKGLGFFFPFLGPPLRAEVKTKQMLLDGASALRGCCCSGLGSWHERGGCSLLFVKELHDPPEWEVSVLLLHCLHPLVCLCNYPCK